MKMAAVPAWLIERRHTANAIAVYVALDLNDGKGTQNELSSLLSLSVPTIKKAIEELIFCKTIRRNGLAIYELRRDDPRAALSTLSTELCTGSQHADSQAEAAPGARSRELSTDSGGPTTTTKLDLGQGGEGETGSGNQLVYPSGSLDSKSSTPPTLLIAVPGKTRKQNLGFNALAEECRADPRSRTGEITKALKRIRPWAWEEWNEGPGVAFEHFVAERIRAQAWLYRRRMKGATLTPTALAKWWFDLEKLPEQGLTPEQIASGDWRD